MEMWNGFERLDFEFEGRKAILVFPKAENRTDNWLFKTEYWNAFPNFEVEMLKRGWYVAYVENQTRWCLDADLDLKARFADHIIQKYGLAKRCVPVGMSCGGMIAVKFAARHPSYVSCLYIDAPVLNLLSCPAGIGVGSGRMLQEFIDATHITLSELINYREHPIDKAPILLENKIPVMLVYGKDDEVVPYCENGAYLERLYRENGGEIQTIGKDNCGHHPHGLEDPTPIVDFVLQHA